MNRTIIMAVGLAVGIGAHAQATTAPVLPSWMAGCWITEPDDHGQRSEECWTAARGTMMLGSGHTFEAGKSLDFEHMRIVRDGETLAFFGQPKGATAVRFQLDRRVAPSGNAPAEISFVNAAHDYPQRITYRLVNGLLEAEISLADGAKPMKWRYRRS